MKNIAALKSFATTARSTLIEQMRIRVKQLLADPKAAAEYPRELARLRDAISTHSEEWVAETAAYTWFNRLTAARYMDANEFSGLYAVVTPDHGSASTLPEILTRAQAGEFPDDVPDEVRAAVTDLLSGRRESTDPDAEAYGLLLNAVFHTWHRPMPEVFPATIDWIRLLTPPDILAPTSVRAQAVAVMDDGACENVEVVGWLYQFYNAEWKEAVDESKAKIDADTIAPKTQLFTPHYIVRYLVENSLGRLWLRSRASSGLRTRMPYCIEPVAGQDDTGIIVSSPEQIRLLDPACGSGHMLTYAFDLLYAIYEEEGHAPSSIPELILIHNLRGLEIDERAAQLASFALAMKARDKDRRFFTRGVQPDIVRVTPVSLEKEEVARITGTVAPDMREAVTRLLYAFTDADTFGSLIRVDAEAVHALEGAVAELDEQGDTDLYTGHAVESARVLLRQAQALVDGRYHVAVANPPYLGSGNMSAELSEFAKKQYPETKADLYAMFIERNAELAQRAGSVAMVTMHGWMFIDSYKGFRSGLASWGHLSSMAHLGTRAFDSIKGEVVQTTAFVIDIASRPTQPGVFLRLVGGRDEAAKDHELLAAAKGADSPIYFTANAEDFSAIPGAPTAYWLTESIRRSFRRSSRLGMLHQIRRGIDTGRDALFVRYWHEISHSDMLQPSDSDSKWHPLNKGGGFRKWYGNAAFVLEWGDSGNQIKQFAQDNPKGGTRVQGLELFHKPVVSWSNISSDRPAFRIFPDGFTFGSTGPSIDGGDQLPSLAGLLNSSVIERLVSAISPTVHLEVGQVSNLPVLPAVRSEVDPIVYELISLFRSDWNDYETSWDFAANPLVVMGGGHLQTHAQTRWDTAIANATRAQELEQSNNRYFAKLYELEDEVACDVSLDRISLTQNPYFRYAPNKDATRTEDEYRVLFFRDLAKELISYAVGCMMGRYSLDKPGLILADAGATIADFDRTVPGARFRPDTDGILPITGEHYFEDDITARLRQFLAVAFGAENAEANLSWLEHALGSGKRKDIRDYFLTDFHTDHVKTYSKRPIYWQVSSPKGGFNALFYLHRYTPATLGLIHQGYAEELLGKLKSRVATIEHALPSAGKREATQLGRERDTLTARHREIRDWIDDALFPLATAEVTLDLDDGVKQNYPKLADVVKKVTGL